MVARWLSPDHWNPETVLITWAARSLGRRLGQSGLDSATILKGPQLCYEQFRPSGPRGHAEADVVAGSYGTQRGPGMTGLECQNCHAFNPLAARFCSSCGNALPKTCSECGTEASDDARFCLHCGHHLATEATSAESELPTGLITYFSPMSREVRRSGSSTFLK